MAKRPYFYPLFMDYLSMTILFIRESVDGFYHLLCATNCCWYDCFDDYEDAHDWSRIASYLVIVTSREVTIAAALNFKISAPAFCQCYRGSDKRDRRKFNSEESKRCY